MNEEQLIKNEHLKNFKEILDNLELSLENGATLSAFISALILPDIGGQICFPELYAQKGGIGKAYAKWYDSEVYQYNYSNSTLLDSPVNLMSGNVVYMIRCKTLHEGNYNHPVIQQVASTYYKELFRLTNKFKYVHNQYESFTLDIEINDLYSSVSKSTDSSEDYKILHLSIMLGKKDFAKTMFLHASEFYNEQKRCD